MGFNDKANFFNVGGSLCLVIAFSSITNGLGKTGVVFSVLGLILFYFDYKRKKKKKKKK